ncbi:hypothetical protein NSI01_21590 [Pimelobacter simplex]|nr:hypothetical protein NSI01_21590 [Pimelobacter simplex]
MRDGWVPTSKPMPTIAISGPSGGSSGAGRDKKDPWGARKAEVRDTFAHFVVVVGHTNITICVWWCSKLRSGRGAEEEVG